MLASSGLAVVSLLLLVQLLLLLLLHVLLFLWHLHLQLYLQLHLPQQEKEYFQHGCWQLLQAPPPPALKVFTTFRGSTSFSGVFLVFYQCSVGHTECLCFFLTVSLSVQQSKKTATTSKRTTTAKRVVPEREEEEEEEKVVKMPKKRRKKTQDEDEEKAARPKTVECHSATRRLFRMYSKVSLSITEMRHSVTWYLANTTMQLRLDHRYISYIICLLLLVVCSPVLLHLKIVQQNFLISSLINCKNSSFYSTCLNIFVSNRIWTHPFVHLASSPNHKKNDCSNVSSL